MKVSIAYASDHTRVWKPLDIDEGSTVEDVISLSGLVKAYDIDLSSQKVGIFGKLTKLNTKVCEGDRIEIYCPITRVLDDDDDDD